MMNYSYCVPILPGGETLMRKWIAEEITENPDHDRVFRLAGIDAEQVWIQRTPMGDFAVVTFGTDDPGKAFRTLSTSNDPWAIKFRNMLTKAHGVDFTKPMPLNEMVADWCVFEKAM
jgi:hypothetical protein